ncbi:APC family permease [Brevibacterium jeotgali]|uniref:Amino acid transporter n=1 Tax=Brevibacterium jeotgali TaxID=1262550 RepID=A0A2H1L5Z6_9MICO|nr:APC family permease [Brevibacterium jeotgali]TWB98839.1 amino acid/polyamine/organocation transporter (APC superfamily) [Brevibacterium jeotgali]SMY12331.1 Amino acid transporter [Brevibacterium jeotgali]
MSSSQNSHDQSTPVDSTAHTETSSDVVRLGKHLKPHWVWAIALGSAIGWGAFILPADWMRDGGGPLAAMLGLAIGGVLMIVIGASYGYLARVFPVSGGAFAYTLVGFGRTHAFVCAWFMTLGYTSIVALNASALALLGKHTVPQIIEVGHLYTVAGWDVYLGEIAVATLALVLFAVVNARGASLSGGVQFIFCLVMILAVLALVIGVIASPAGSFSNVTPLTDGRVNPVVGVTVIVAIAPWAYIGFDNIPQAAEEFAFPARKAFRLIVWSLIAAAALYCVMILVTASAAPWQDMMGEDRVWATADAVTSSMGGVGLALLVIAAVMGIVTGLNGFYVAGSRVLLALGRAQMIPRVFQRVHPRFGTPHAGLLFVMVAALAAPWFGRTALSWIVDMASIGFTFAFLYTSACAFRLLRWSGSADRSALPGSASTWRKLASAAGVLIAVAFILLLLVPGSPAQLSVPSFMAMGVWIVIGAVFFAVRRSHSRTLTDEQVDQAVLGGPRPDFLVRNGAGARM